MAGFTKLYNQILLSTIWLQPDHVRILWITMLALKNQNSEVMASIPGLADAAKISLENCEEGLKVLMSPDPYSRTKEDEGRRIREIDGGWLIINGQKYRDKMSDEDRREYKTSKQRQYRTEDRLWAEVRAAIGKFPRSGPCEWSDPRIGQAIEEIAGSWYDFVGKSERDLHFLRPQFITALRAL